MSHRIILQTPLVCEQIKKSEKEESLKWNFS